MSRHSIISLFERPPFILAIFGFRSVGAYSRVQIQNYISGLWLCMNQQGRVIVKVSRRVRARLAEDSSHHARL